MGHRALKRVPLDFQWPLNEIWKGYINPYPGPVICAMCDGSGYNVLTKKIEDEFYDHENFGILWKYDYGFAPDGNPTDRPPSRSDEKVSGMASI